MELHDRIRLGPSTEPPDRCEAPDAGRQAGKRPLLLRAERAGDLERHPGAQEPNGEESGVSQGKAAEDDGTGFHEVVGGIVGQRHGVHRLAQQRESAGAERDHQAILRAEQAVDRAGCGPHGTGGPANGERLEAFPLNDALGGIEEGRCRALVMFAWPGHGDSVAQRCYDTVERNPPDGSEEAPMGTTPATNFDVNPPVPAAAYEYVVKGVNMGYEFIFELTHAFLRALGKRDLDLLVVGAGGGAEIETFLPGNPGWRITGVDPSRQMLDLARAKAARLGVADRVTLIEGSVDDLPADRRFDAATCMFVLHFLADDAKRGLLRGMRRHLAADAPAVSVSGCRVDAATAGPLQDDLLGAWRQYGEHRGVPAEQMRAIVEEVVARQAQGTPEARYRELMHEAGFTHAVTVLSLMHDAMCAWIAR